MVTGASKGGVELSRGSIKSNDKAESFINTVTSIYSVGMINP